MKIDVNNGGTVELVAQGGGVTVTSRDHQGEATRRDFFDDGEVVAALNMLRYMRDEGLTAAYVFDDDTRHYLRNLIAHDDIAEFPILQ